MGSYMRASPHVSCKDVKPRLCSNFGRFVRISLASIAVPNSQRTWRYYFASSDAFIPLNDRPMVAFGWLVRDLDCPCWPRAATKGHTKSGRSKAAF